MFALNPHFPAVAEWPGRPSFGLRMPHPPAEASQTCPSFSLCTGITSALSKALPPLPFAGVSRSKCLEFSLFCWPVRFRVALLRAHCHRPIQACLLPHELLQKLPMASRPPVSSFQTSVQTASESVSNAGINTSLFWPKAFSGSHLPPRESPYIS